MIRISAILLCLLTFGSQAALPTISCSPSRTSGTAPLGVFLDCTDTTDSGTTRPFHDLEYRHSFGDSYAGRWIHGANSELTKNQATGPVAAHVYEKAGTYTITSVVDDGTNMASTSSIITVHEADTTYSGEATTCIANTRATAGADGCPIGAVTPMGTSDFDAALASCIGTMKRCLFKRGDIFIADVPVSVTRAGPITIGAYGPSSAPPPVVKAANSRAVLVINNSAVNDLRISDLEIVGNGTTDTSTGIQFGASASNITILRVTIRETGRGISVGGTAAISGSVIQESTINNYHAPGGNAFFGRARNSAFLGNYLGPVPSAGRGEHLLRLQRGQKVVISSNTLTTPNANKHNLAIRGDSHVTAADDSFYVYVSDNKLVGGINAWTMQIAPSADTQNNHIYDVLVERNWFLSGASTRIALVIQATRVTVRNNIIDLTGGTGRTGVSIGNRNTSGIPTPDRNEILNNTIHSNDRAGNFIGIQLGSAGEDITNTTVKNNLAYAPHDSLHALLRTGARVSGTVASNNSDTMPSGKNGVLISPAFDGPLTTPQGYRIGVGSYARSDGTAMFPATNSDFFQCRDKSGNARIGALVPRALAICGNRQVSGMPDKHQKRLN